MEKQKLHRANYKPISSLSEPVYSRGIPSAEMESIRGALFVATTGSISVVANGFLALRLSNPTSSYYANIQRFSGGSTVNTTIDIYKNATLTATGTSFTPRNFNTLYTDNSSMNVEYLSQGTNPVSGGTLLSTFVQTGGILFCTLDAALKIAPGTNVVLRLTNNTNQTNLCSINVLFCQTPVNP